MSRKDRKPATLKDIAAEAGVSVNTASLALRESPRISGETRKRVHRIARRMQYVPNSAARNLARKRSGLIGIYTRALYDAVRTRLINRLFAELHTAEYRPILGLAENANDPWYASPWMRTFQELKVEALVVVVEGVDRLHRWPARVPTVLVGCQPMESLQCDYLGLDRREGAKLGVAHLVARGHKKILVACAEKADFAQGCFEQIAAAGLQAMSVNLTQPSDEKRLHAVLDFLAGTTEKPTAAIFGDSPLAAQFMHRMEELGYRVPGDIAVVGYDYFPWADMLKTSLTTVEQPIAEMASEAVKMIRARLADLNCPPMRMVLPHRLVVRESA